LSGRRQCPINKAVVALSQRDEANIELVAGLICSQENDPGTGKSPREIEKKETGISRSSVCRIARHDVQLKVFERKKGTCCLTLIEFLQQNVPDDIKQALWPTNSPDMNSVDYAVCGALQQMVYRDSITSLNDLKEKIRRCWVELSQKLFDCAVDQLDLDYMPLSRPREAILNSCLTDFLSMSV